MNKQFCTFILTKQLDFFGFNERCFSVVYPDGEVYTGSPDFVAVMCKKTPEALPAPTWQQVIDWFIKEHDIFIAYGCNQSGWYWELTKTNGTTILNQTDHAFFDNHYKAIEAGTLKALEIIEKRAIGKRMM